ncbi:MAG: DUF1801 domain-containing protein [Candidatus Andersenbacteria bacterium]|nr:DUF1801 domain-containing protein [Candidatus Andersenbacteria bacterium]
MRSNAKTVTQYLQELPEDRRKEVEKVRRVILTHLPKGYEEGMQYGMIGYYIPLAEYPDTYNGEALGIAALASQKQKISLYLMGVYSDPKLLEAFQNQFTAEGKKLDMGKSCVRFTSAEDLSLDAVAEVIRTVSPAQYIALYEATRGATRR